jgi:hypothetical protein
LIRPALPANQPQKPNIKNSGLNKKNGPAMFVYTHDHLWLELMTTIRAGAATTAGAAGRVISTGYDPPTALSVKNRDHTRRMPALTIFTRDRLVRLPHRTQHIEASTAICTKIFVNWHGVTSGLL